MKIICSKTSLLKGVNIVLKAVPVRTTMDILECIYINAENGSIKLTANDMELGIETVVEGSILEEGHIALSARLFSDIVRKLPDNDITITTDENFHALITCEKAKFNIAGRSGDDFVQLPRIEKQQHYAISQFSLKQIISKTIFSAASGENNPIMTGEYFEFADNTLKVTALDGQRIAIRKIELKESYEPAGIIVPGKTMNEISKILTDDIDSEVSIYITNLHILFEFDNTTVVSRLIEGKYFDVVRMISSDYNTRMVIGKRDLQGCIDRATLLIRESDRNPIILSVRDSAAELTVQSEIGSMDEVIDIDQEGSDITIGFNPRFMLDAIRVIDEDDIPVYMNNSRTPLILRDDAGTYTYVILPINF